METSAERRRRKLKELTDGGKWSAVVELAKDSGLNPASLDQIIKGVLNEPRKDGTRTPKNLGDAAARQIEQARNLGVGWFDSPDSAAPARPAAVSEMNPDHVMLISLLTEDELAYMQALAVALILHRQPALSLVLEKTGVAARTNEQMVNQHLKALRSVRPKRGGHLGGVDTGFGGLDEAAGGST